MKAWNRICKKLLLPPGWVMAILAGFSAAGAPGGVSPGSGRTPGGIRRLCSVRIRLNGGMYLPGQDSAGILPGSQTEALCKSVGQAVHDRCCLPGLDVSLSLSGNEPGVFCLQADGWDCLFLILVGSGCCLLYCPVHDPISFALPDEKHAQSAGHHVRVSPISSVRRHAGASQPVIDRLGGANGPGPSGVCLSGIHGHRFGGLHILYSRGLHSGYGQIPGIQKSYFISGQKSSALRLPWCLFCPWRLLCWLSTAAEKASAGP